MKKYLLFFCVFCVFIFLSCEKQKNGKIIDMWYEPSRTYTQLMPVCTGKVITLIPFTFYDDEDWCITVSGVGVSGDTIIRTYYVTPSAYDTLFVGKFICIDGNCDGEDSGNTKVRQ